MRLFSWFIVRRLVREPLRTATTVAGIAAGVAVVVAIQLTNASSIAGFETALNAVSGRASLEIVNAAGGVDERTLPDLGWLRAYGAVTPIIEGDVAFPEANGRAETLRVLGIDILRDEPFRDYRLVEWNGSGAVPTARDLLGLLSDPSSAILPDAFAGPRGLRPGSTFDVRTGDRTVALTVRALLKNEGPARALDGRVVLMDIAAAQALLNRFGTIDRLEIRLADGADIDRAEAAIARRLPASLSVERPSTRGRQVETMLAAFHLNLTALSYIALIVGVFLVYNTISVTVLSRRPEIGALRAVGVTRGQVRRLFLGEAAALAIVGSALGLGLGRVLANAAVALTSTTVTALYVATAAAPPALGWRHVLLAFGTGVPLSLVAAFVPAQEATRVPPAVASRGADRAGAKVRPPRRLVATGAALIALGAWLATRGPVHGLPLLGYASAAALIFGASLLVPAVIIVCVRVLDRPVRHWLGIAERLALGNLGAAIPRLSISIAALAVSLSMTAAIAIMVGSFRETVVYWVRQTLQADLFVSPGSGEAPGRAGTLSADVVQTIEHSPDAAVVDPLLVADVPYDGTRIRIVGRDLGVVLTRAPLLFKAPSDGPASLRDAAGQDLVAASESFTLKHHARVGDAIALPTAEGIRSFRLAATYYDYSNDRGVILMDAATFARHFERTDLNGMAVYLRPGVDADRARRRLLDAIGSDHAVYIATNAGLRAEVLRIFDSTFAITYALELVAIVVAMLGVSGTLVTLILEREREFTILRLVGAGRGQVRRTVIGEAVLIGGISQAIGLVVGGALSLVLIDVITPQSFGWTIQFHLPSAFLAQSSVAIVAATALAALYPAARAVRLTMRRDE